MGYSGQEAAQHVYNIVVISRLAGGGGASLQILFFQVNLIFWYHKFKLPVADSFCLGSDLNIIKKFVSGLVGGKRGLCSFFHQIFFFID